MPRLVALTVSVVDPGLGIVVEIGEIVSPDEGIVVRVTVEVKPLIPTMVTFTFDVTAGRSGPMVVGFAVMVKSTTFNVTLALWVNAILVPVTVMM